MEQDFNPAVKNSASQPTNDEDWVEQIQKGDYVAFEALFSAYYEDLFKFVRSYLRSPQVAEELVQDIFFNIWRGRHQWSPHGSLKAYLYGAARNHAAKYKRHQHIKKRWQMQKERDPKPVSAGPEDALRHRELQQALQRAVAEMPERRRLIYMLSRNRNLTYAEIAAVLGISINTVKVQMGRALKFLRHRLAPFL